jgi:hypothetical protein
VIKKVTKPFWTIRELLAYRKNCCIRLLAEVAGKGKRKEGKVIQIEKNKFKIDSFFTFARSLLLVQKIFKKNIWKQ